MYCVLHVYVCGCYFFFFFKQKTAYEMRISDWSSDVCSSDLHPSTVTGLAFNPKGRRLVASHYGGVSLWWAKAEAQQPKRFSWKGSHVAVTWSGDGRFVITATQESELHGWRLADGADMRRRDRKSTRLNSSQ